MKRINLLNTLKKKLIVYFLMIAIIPSVCISFLGYNTSKKSMQQDATDKLTIIRDTKKKEIEDYFQIRKNRISFIAQDPTVIQAMREFSQSINSSKAVSQVNILNNSDYNKVYQKYNSLFVNFDSKLENGDVLLVDSNTGNIVYSIFKEKDYGTNLISGPYKSTNIAKAFEAARNSTDKNFTIVEDYEFYEPYDNKPVACIAAPIFDGNKKIGIFIFKMKTDKIDSIISNGSKWEDLGIGDSGDVILIGDDYKLRSNTRFLSEETDEKIKAANSAILLKEIKSKGTSEVMSGKSNIDKYNDHNGDLSIVAYAPLHIDNLKWALLVKIDESEAFYSANRLRNLTLYIMLISTILIIIASYIISTNISRPIKKMSQVFFEISEGDLTIEIPKENRSDEIGILMNAVSKMFNNLKEQTREIINVVNILSSSVSEITVSLTQVSSGAMETSSAVSETTSTIEEFKQTIYMSSEKTKGISTRAKESIEISQVGSKATEDTIEGMNSINSQMQEIAQSILALSEQSQNISELIESVDNISEQSNLLAVNASIEAAKAGEYGKGFSIVAQEIRNLAEQSKQTTKQVRNILKDIQKASNTAVMTTEKGIKFVAVGVDEANKAGVSIQKLMENINLSSQGITQIEASTQQQLVGMDQVSLAMEDINKASIQNVDSMKQLEEATQGLQEMGQKLKQLIENYKL